MGLTRVFSGVLEAASLVVAGVTLHERAAVIASSRDPKMATQATLTSAFVRAAIKFNASESDYLVLESNGIHTFEALAYRVPKADDLEDL